MPGKYDFRPFEELYPLWEERFRIGAGSGDFSFKPQGRPGPYGSTDMVFARATLGILNLPAEDADAWADRINSFQDERTGWYRKTYTPHFREHTTAYAVAALSLLGKPPRYLVRACQRISSSRHAMVRWLRSIPWSIIWPASHAVSGLPAILHLTGAGSDRFFEEYFDWLDHRVEASTGYWSRGLAQRLGFIPMISKEEMGGAFHLYYVYQARGRTWPRLHEVVDATLSLQRPNGFWDGDHPYCIDLDGIYSIVRSSHLAGGYRRADALAACEAFLKGARAVLNSKALLFSRYPDSHHLVGALSAVAECERAFPGLVETHRPWSQTLDRACFI